MPKRKPWSWATKPRRLHSAAHHRQFAWDAAARPRSVGSLGDTSPMKATDSTPRELRLSTKLRLARSASITASRNRRKFQCLVLCQQRGIVSADREVLWWKTISPPLDLTEWSRSYLRSLLDRATNMRHSKQICHSELTLLNGSVFSRSLRAFRRVVSADGEDRRRVSRGPPAEVHARSERIPRAKF